MIELQIISVPLPWKAPYVGSRGAFSPRTEVANIIKRQIASDYKGEVLQDSIGVDLIFYMPIPKATSQKKRALMISGELRPKSTPDRTNMAKLYEDILQDIVYTNDSLIADGRVAKYYGEVPRIEIKIWKI